MNDTILINRLPTRTWNRLGVNETAIAWGQADDLGEEKITAAGQTERLEITGSGERGEKMVDIHAPAGQTVTVFETLRAEKGLLVRTALHVEKDAKVRLVQIQNAAQDSLLRLETSGECAENGQVELILCAEENVVGNHGATIGELDEDMLFYFESRGISAAEAENIMARAAIERLARTIEDEAAQAAILSELEEVL